MPMKPFLLGQTKPFDFSMEDPLIEDPTTEELPLEEPPIEHPTTEELPVEEPPIVAPPVQEPPLVEHPLVEPPIVEPPVVEPPLVEHPVEEPPTVEISIEAPPIEEPPTEEISVEDPLIPLPEQPAENNSNRVSRKEQASTHAVPLSPHTKEKKTPSVLVKRQEVDHPGISTRGLVRIISFSLVFLLVLSVLNLQQKQRATLATQKLTLSYGRLLGDTSSSLQRIDGILRKLPYVYDPITMHTLSIQLAEEASFATHHFSKLPLEQSIAAAPQRFLSQLHQYGIQLSRRFAGAENPLPLPYQTLQTLTALQQQTQEFSSQMMTVQELFQADQSSLSQAVVPLAGMSFFDLTEILKNEEALEEIVTSNSEDPVTPNTEEGVTSEAVDSNVSVVTNRSANISSVSDRLVDAPTITLTQARVIATKASGVSSFEREQEVKAAAPGMDTPESPALYLFQQGQTSVSVTQNGGHLYQMSKPRQLGARTLTETEAHRQAVIYLTGMEMPRLHHTATAYRDDFEVVMFAFSPLQGEVFLYTDIVQIAIALDTGEIVWVNASSYVQHHGVRRDLSPTVPLEHAMQKINPRLTLEGTLLCLRPADTRQQQAGVSPQLCYEFRCSSPTGTSLRLYINAITGAGEDLIFDPTPSPTPS